MEDSINSSIGSISVSVSKGSVYEIGGLSMYDATLDDALGREEKSLSNEEIRKGDTLLDTYNVEADAISGGMGSVWRVHHQSWNTDLAMKRPQPRFFAEGSKRRKESFIKECEAWINLGLHPNIVSCYYVREIGGVPTIFSEWMNNGSLKDRIRDGALYEGTETEQEEWLLDLAIQFARGLRYSHENGLIHRDVKPDNLLLTKDCNAKVADFGLAKARDEAISEEGVVRKGGYTPEYCSSEQAAELDTDARTDIYSWALSVLEMYTKGRVWKNGSEVSENREAFFDATKLSLPAKLRTLLHHCLEANVDNRPESFAEIEAILHEVYKEETGDDYPREASKAAADTADSLNNRALSFLDLGKADTAELYWERALIVTPNHVETLYNQSLYLWRAARIHDVEAIRRTSNGVGPNVDYYLAQLYLESMDIKNAAAYIRKCEFLFSNIKELEVYLKEEAEKEQTQTFSGHRNIIHTVCFSPDGTKFLSGSHDKTVKLWDMKTGKCIRTFKGHKRWVRSVCFSPNGQRILSASADKTIKLWNPDMEECEFTLSGHTDWVESVCFSPDGTKILSGSHDNTIKLWDVNTKECIRTLCGHRIVSACFSPDGTYILSADEYQIIRLWNTDTGECIKTWQNHSGSGQTLCLSPDGKTFLSGGSNGIVKLWDIKMEESICELEGNPRGVCSVCFSPDGKSFLSSGWGAIIQLWDTETKVCKRTFMKHGDCIESVCFSPDGKKVLSGSVDKTMSMWSINSPKYFGKAALSKIYSINQYIHERQKFELLCKDVRESILFKDIDNAFKQYNKLNDFPLYKNSKEYFEAKNCLSKYCRKVRFLSYYSFTIEEEACSACFSPDGALMLFGNRDGTMRLLNTATRDIVCTYAGHTEHVMAVGFHPDGSNFFSASYYDNTIKLWDIKTGACIRVFDGHTKRIRAACFSPDGSRIIVYLRNKWESLFVQLNTETFEVVGTIGVNRYDYVQSVCFSPCGNEILAGGKTVKLWDGKTGECIHKMEGDYRHVDSVCFSPDGSKILSASRGQIMIWDAATGQIVRTLQGQIGGSICISPDGSSIFSTGTDNTIRLWNVYTGEDIHVISGHKNKIDAVYISSDGSKTLSVALKNQIERNRENILCFLDWEITFPGWADWDDGAQPYLNNFIILHPNWTDKDFDGLITELQNCGYGWLWPEGVRAKLKEMGDKAPKGLFGWEN